MEETNMKRLSHLRRDGFTVVELLVVLFVSAVLIALVAPAT
jgi:prepilin-type N-terminal cleavage/methylation domain-containing protein